MAWESTLFKKTRLGVYKNCLALFEAYADCAPVWQRLLLATYVGFGPPMARWFGGNTRTLWQQADAIIGDLFAASRMSPPEIVTSLRQYLRIKLEEDDHLSFNQARELIYDQAFYPLVTHFTFALQPSAVARMRFVKRVVESIGVDGAAVADLGCGSGMMLSEVLKLKPTWKGYGLDVSEAAIAYAKHLALHKSLGERAHFQTGCITDLPFASQSLDVVIASEVVEHLPKPERIFREFFRVLVPGGLLLVTMPVESNTPAHLNALGTADELRELCESAGLTVCSVQSKWHLSFGDDPRHIFAVAQAGMARETETHARYSLSLPQMSSAASSGMVSS